MIPGGRSTRPECAPGHSRSGRIPRTVAWLVALGLAGACSSSSGFGPTVPVDGTLDIELTLVATGLESPVLAVSPIADPRLFIVEQPGRIRVVRDGTLAQEPFLDITDRVRFAGEQGLLGLTFDPDFRASGRFFVNYTDMDGNTRVEAYLDRDQSDVADPNTGMLFLEIEQPFANHNGGHIAFGPDNMLYVAVGDGGSGGDPEGHGQDTQTLLGTILRLDVLDQLGPPYRIPADNPFADGVSGRPEIWHWGLRNPWRFSFDRDGGWLTIGDVGQDRWEEINVVAIDDGGANFGWNSMEGAECFRGADCDAEGLTLPAAVYGHETGCSVTGGFVYRGSSIPALHGKYVYSDFCEGWLRTFEIDSNRQAGNPAEILLPEPIGQVTSFGVDAQDELYVVTSDGRVLRVSPAS